MAEWQRRNRLFRENGAGRNAGPKTVIAKVGQHLDFSPCQPLPRANGRVAIRVATILDDFSANAWRFEWDCIAVRPESWRDELEKNPVSMLFVESAWAGNDKAWSYHLTGPNAPRQALVELVDWCKSQGVPTVFWNKEDPPHYGDFLDTARLFDVVLTSDSTRLEQYRADLGHDRIRTLSFAAQPAIHNPVRPHQGFQSRDVAFAGMYFAHKFPERRQQMHMLLHGALDVSSRMDHGLDIYSRQFGGDTNYQFPAPFDAHVVGSLPYEKMLTAYKAYKVFLNVNSVVDSPSMCARRIFEIIASGTPVVTAPSAAIANFFEKSEVAEVRTRAESAHMIQSLVRSKELRDRTVHLGQRNIWEHHTYAHRAEQVLDSAGIVQEEPDPLSLAHRPSISTLVSTIRPHRLSHILTTVGAQTNVDVELVLLTHGFEIDERAVRAEARRHGLEHIVFLHEPLSTSLGRCLNRAASASGGNYVTKMDDDDLYGSHYLQDQAVAHRYSGASVVGKQAHYMHLAEHDATLLRFGEREHRFTDLVMGPTIFTTREIMLEMPFLDLGRGEDTNFLKGVSRAGGSIYSADRFNFVQMRSGDGKGHTWSVRESELLATGIISSFGLNEQHIMF